VLCSSKLESWRHNTVYCTPAVARRLVLTGARDSRALRSTRRGATVRGAPRGPRERCQSFRRLRFCRRHVASSSATTGSATRVSENLSEGSWSVAVPETEGRGPSPESMIVPGPALFADAVPDAAAVPGPFFRSTGLPSRAAHVAPSLRLAALRWHLVIGLLGRYRPPSGVSTAFLPAVTRFAVTESRGSPTRHCAHRNSNAIGTIPCTAHPSVRPNPFSVTRACRDESGHRDDRRRLNCLQDRRRFAAPKRGNPEGRVVSISKTLML
jgi:hypothetical protein